MCMFLKILRRAIISFHAALFLLLCTHSAHADSLFLPGGAGDFGVLYEGHGGNTLSFNNSNLTGNIGIGGTGKFQGNGPGTINGSIDFSAANTGQYSNSGLAITPSSGNPLYNISAVTTALNGVNSLSQTLGLEAGTGMTISSGGSISAGSGMLDSHGFEVFKVTSIGFPNGTFTINGTASQYVVLNIAGNVASNGLNGSIVLRGGITSDHVLFNFTPSTNNLTTYNNDYSTLSGGPTMTISTSGLTTTGVFLDPTGNFQANHAVIDGRIFGGDSQNSSLVSGLDLNAPASVPPPGNLTLAVIALASFAAFRFRVGGSAFRL